jgi:hypothetical protein
MDKTFDFKGKELRITDDLIEIDSRPLKYDQLEAITYKKAALFKKGELRIKPRGDDEEVFTFPGVINNQVSEIAGRLCKNSGLPLKMVKKAAKKDEDI